VRTKEGKKQLLAGRAFVEALKSKIKCEAWLQLFGTAAEVFKRSMWINRNPMRVAIHFNGQMEGF
jgi:hypothetical protein